MKNLNRTSETSRESNAFSHFSSELKKLWAGIALSTALLMGNPAPATAQAQTPEKQTPPTEQVEKQKVPDMIQFAKENLLKYYNKDDQKYFEHIFLIISGVEQKIQNVANYYLQKHWAQFKDEKDRITFILMTIELLNWEIKFTEKYEEKDDLDWRMVAANDVVQDMTKHFKEENARAKEENARAKEENARAKEENARAKEENARAKEENARAKEKRRKTKENLAKIKKDGEKAREKTKEALEWLRRILSEVSIEMVKSNKGVQEVVLYYAKFCKEEGYLPNEHEKKLIEAIPKK